MKKLNSFDVFAVAAVIILTCSFARCKDHSADYQMGTLTKVPLHVENRVDRGITDTWHCEPGVFSTSCDGGITDKFSGDLIADTPDGKVLIGPCLSSGWPIPCDQPYILRLTESNGTVVFLDHLALRHDSAQNLDTTSKVLYRTEHHGWVNFVMIPDPTNPKKEGSYSVVKLPKQPVQPTAPAASNISAMCTSDKLAPKLKAQYCP